MVKLYQISGLSKQPNMSGRTRHLRYGGNLNLLIISDLDHEVSLEIL